VYLGQGEPWRSIPYGYVLVFRVLRTSYLAQLSNGRTTAGGQGSARRRRGRGNKKDTCSTGAGPESIPPRRHSFSRTKRSSHLLPPMTPVATRQRGLPLRVRSAGRERRPVLPERAMGQWEAERRHALLEAPRTTKTIAQQSRLPSESSLPSSTASESEQSRSSTRQRNTDGKSDPPDPDPGLIRRPLTAYPRPLPPRPPPKAGRALLRHRLTRIPSRYQRKN